MGTTTCEERDIPRRLTARERDVLGALRAAIADEDGRWWNGRRWMSYVAGDVIATFEYIAGECGRDVTGSAVRECVAGLVRSGYVRPVGRFRRHFLHVRLTASASRERLDR